MRAEQVIHANVRSGSPIYLANPLYCPTALLKRAGDASIPQDAEVWTCFESWSLYNPWIKKDANGPMGVLTSIIHCLDGFDERLF